ncbi:unnamed protein product [Amoebophrya sp. A120]|nr:unnamed protein product [Amoebophrya sp. A120]|eukprot:GSA120T00005171001.1
MGRFRQLMDSHTVLAKNNHDANPNLAKGDEVGDIDHSVVLSKRGESVKCWHCEKSKKVEECPYTYVCSSSHHFTWLCSEMCQQRFQKQSETTLKQLKRMPKTALNRVMLTTLDEVRRKNADICPVCTACCDFYDNRKAFGSDEGEASTSAASEESKAVALIDVAELPDGEQDAAMLSEVEEMLKVKVTAGEKTEEDVEEVVENIALMLENGELDDDLVQAVQAVASKENLEHLKKRYQRFREAFEIWQLHQREAQFMKMMTVVTKKKDEEPPVVPKSKEKKKDAEQGEAGGREPASSSSMSKTSTTASSAGAAKEGLVSSSSSSPQDASSPLESSAGAGTAKDIGTAQQVAKSEKALKAAAKKKEKEVKTKPANKKSGPKFVYSKNILETITTKLAEILNIAAPVGETDELENWVMGTLFAHELDLGKYVNELVRDCASMQWGAFCSQHGKGAKKPSQVDTLSLIHFVAFLGDRMPQALSANVGDTVLDYAMRLAGATLHGSPLEKENTTQEDLSEQQLLSPTSVSVAESAPTAASIAARQPPAPSTPPPARTTAAKVAAAAAARSAAGTAPTSKPPPQPATGPPPPPPEAVVPSKPAARVERAAPPPEPVPEPVEAEQTAVARPVKTKSEETTGSSLVAEACRTERDRARTEEKLWQCVRFLAVEFYAFLVIVGTRDYSVATRLQERWVTFLELILEEDPLHSLGEPRVPLSDGVKKALPAEKRRTICEKLAALTEVPLQYALQILRANAEGWFFEAKRLLPEFDWHRCSSPTTGKHWFLNGVTGEWFFEDRSTEAGWQKQLLFEDAKDAKPQYQKPAAWFIKIRGEDAGRWFHMKSLADTYV